MAVWFKSWYPMMAILPKNHSLFVKKKPNSYMVKFLQSALCTISIIVPDTLLYLHKQLTYPARMIKFWLGRHALAFDCTIIV